MEVIFGEDHIIGSPHGWAHVLGLDGWGGRRGSQLGIREDAGVL